ncbi:hypothetical protein ACRALDRAFT_2057967 [Sodiomyces alcalophilus JCM 7366]|uniref:uncharacterized protein n=1 Tax=Sodiomyces alcalophilus JCM 7366 TaxID=591952 RepID=UPI0039B40ACC
MDGSYQNPYLRANSPGPMSPNHPTTDTSAYRANVNRTKTRKWVEAKTQNYDGDDWGGGDDFGPEPEPMPVPLPLRVGGPHGPYQSPPAPPSSVSAPAPAPLPASEPTPPSLQQPTGPDTLQASQDSADPLPLLQAPVPQQSIHSVPSSAGETQSMGSRLEPPVSVASNNEAPDATAPLSRPDSSMSSAEQHRRVEDGGADSPDQTGSSTHEVAGTEDKDSVAAPREATSSVATSPGVTRKEVDVSPGGPTHGLNTASQGSDGAAAEGSSDYVFDRVLAQPQPTYPKATTTARFPRASAEHPEPSQPDESAADVPQDKPNRFASSPQLPDLARMSLFGDDLFSTTTQPSTITPTPAVAAVQEDPTQSPQSSSVPLPTDTTMDKPAPHLTTKPEKPTQDAAHTTSDSQSVDGGAAVHDPNDEAAAQTPKPSQPPHGISIDSIPETSPPAQGTRRKEIEIPSAPAISVDSDNVSPVSEHAAAGEIQSHNDSTAPADRHDPAQPSQSDAGSPKSDTALTPTKGVQASTNERAQHATNAAQDDSVGPKEPQMEPSTETDKLTEDIIRSLSPIRPTSAEVASGDDEGPGRSQPGLGRESRYLSGVYDDYWAATDDKHLSLPISDPKPPAAAARNNEAAGAASSGVSEIPPLSPRRAEPEATAAPVSRPLSRRFSWEAEELVEKKSSATNAPASPLTVVVGPSLLPHEASQSGAGKRESAIGPRDHATSPRVAAAPSGHPDPEAHEPPSPVSAASVQDSSPSAEQKNRLSLPEEKLPVSSPSAHPALAHSQGPSAPAKEVSAPPTPHAHSQPTQRILTFKEIRELPTAADRIAKYNDTRTQFAAMDSGLTGWLLDLQAEHPEHANASPSFRAMMMGAQAATGHGSPGSALKSPAQQQQPYYQQYLNAAAPNTAAAPPGRPSSSSMPMGSHLPSSDFKHSSGQVGAKGKELLLAAGKAGKGLLSKGRHKLRGDKVFS